jgi:hypothetical protein
MYRSADDRVTLFASNAARRGPCRKRLALPVDVLHTDNCTSASHAWTPSLPKIGAKGR